MQTSIDGICELGGIRSILCISFIAINVEVIGTGCGLDMLVVFDSINPHCPPAARSWCWPISVDTQDTAQSDHPGSELNVDIREMWSKEERSVHIAGCYDLGNLVLQFLGTFSLLGDFLCLKVSVECWNDLAVDLYVFRPMQLQSKEG